MFSSQVLNRYLNRAASSKIQPSDQSWSISVFQAYGFLGLISGSILTLFLELHLALPSKVTAGLILTAVLTFLGLAVVTKVTVGIERLIYYHHLIAVVGTAVLLLKLLQQPILPNIDNVILGVGLFQACGRIGCLRVGCCYGRPYHWGICYRQERADFGLPAYLVGVRLFPTQAIESLWGIFIVYLGSLMIFYHSSPGTAFAWYVLSYSAARFCLEFFRGDPERPYILGFSEAQWTSLLLITAVVWASFSKILPFQGWYVGVLGTVLLIGLIIVLKRRFQASDEYHLLHPNHIREVAESLELVAQLATRSSPLSTIHIARTSLGLQISASRIKNTAGPLDHYTLSSEGEALNRAKASVIARLILQLKQIANSVELIEGNQGVFHLIVH